MAFMFWYQNENSTLFIFVINQVRGAYQAAARLIRTIKEPKTKERFQQRQASLQKAIEKVEQRIKEVEDRIRAAAPKNPSGKTENLTLHGHERLQQRGISEKEVRDAIEEANRSGRVTIKMGKYGTPQTLYETENGLTVVVETSGRNTGKVITAWRKQP
jgi:hypothetical protein